ncbi:CLUMA_CG006293, isoform A [Clunio marinus]|uniref:CLUMA_CG006293, isoform A n=1 Tax=Clunio marinus TaxID=568069 RepID=A0A1J1I328_9DIPT|nr:CLUMA_CG006293, isoform A [Clunio marinus]
MYSDRKDTEMSDTQNEIFKCISNGNIIELKSKLASHNGSIDFTDENGMTPLQHSAYKGSKEIVQLLLDLGADVNSSKHEFHYTALHFAALSGDHDVCLLLLSAGANPNAINSVGRTPAQMGAFVSNHKAVSTINNFVSIQEIEYYTKIHGQETEPSLPPVLLDSFHKFVIYPNIHPVRICLNLQKFGIPSKHYVTIKKILQKMTEREMNRNKEINEIMAFKYHYLSWIIKEIIACHEHFEIRNRSKAVAQNTKSEYLEMFVKRILKPNKEGQLDYVEIIIRECVRDFEYRDCTIFQQIVRQLASKDTNITALDVIKQSLNGQRSFQDEYAFCKTCGEEKPDKKCSKCKQVQYCDRECQRLHWWMHKKECARLSLTVPLETASSNSKSEIDQTEISSKLQKLMVG